MFHKQFRVKSNTAIKGSERKKLRSEFSRQYPDVVENQLAMIFSSKEDMTVMKICTHSGDDLLVYTVQKNPVLFNVENILYPTVYFLWKFPDIIPTLTTWPDVLNRLIDGADLMLPGVIVNGPHGPDALGKFTKNQGCAVNLRGNHAAVAVGKTTMSNVEMLESGMRGKGVIIMHTYGDQLWAAGDKSELPLLSEAKVSASAQGNERETAESRSLEGQLADLHASGVVGLSEHDQEDAQNGSSQNVNGSVDNCTSTDIESANDHQSIASQRLENREDCSEELPEEKTVDNGVSQDAMDDLFYQCFMCAFKTTAKRSELPLLTSTFFRNHMIPCCPAGSILDVKKSSYKKLSKFLSAMARRGLIQVKELSKGVESIVAVYLDHDEYRSFKVPDSLPACLPASEASKTPSGEQSITYSPPSIVEMYQVTTTVLPLMKDRRKGDALTPQDVRQHITDYVKSCNLQDANNRSLVTLDPILCDALVARNEYLEAMRWDELVERCLKKMTVCHQITFNGSESQIRRGHFEPIVLDVVQRGANKKMTSVYNLEEFGIDPEQFKSLVQKGVACSTSVCPRTDRPKSTQVLVQGNQINYISQLLRERYGLPSKYIRGLDKAPKMSKKK